MFKLFGKKKPVSQVHPSANNDKYLLVSSLVKQGYGVSYACFKCSFVPTKGQEVVLNGLVQDQEIGWRYR